MPSLGVLASFRCPDVDQRDLLCGDVHLQDGSGWESRVRADVEDFGRFAERQRDPGLGAWGVLVVADQDQQFAAMSIS